MSVSADHPPASSTALRRQMPAEPLNVVTLPTQARVGFWTKKCRSMSRAMRRSEEPFDRPAPRPAGLNERDLGVVEAALLDEEPAARKLGSGTKSASNRARNSLSDALEALRQRAGLVALRFVRCRCSMRTPVRAHLVHHSATIWRRLVGRIVQHLDVEAVPGIVLRGRRPNDLFGRGPLVVERDLDRYRRRHRIDFGARSLVRLHRRPDGRAVAQEAPEHAQLDEGEGGRQYGGHTIEKGDKELHRLRPALGSRARRNTAGGKRYSRPGDAGNPADRPAPGGARSTGPSAACPCPRALTYNWRRMHRPHPMHR